MNKSLFYFTELVEFLIEVADIVDNIWICGTNAVQTNPDDPIVSIILGILGRKCTNLRISDVVGNVSAAQIEQVVKVGCIFLITLQLEYARNNNKNGGQKWRFFSISNQQNEKCLSLFLLTAVSLLETESENMNSRKTSQQKMGR